MRARTILGILGAILLGVATSAILRPGSVAAAPGCDILQVQSALLGGPSRLLRVDLPAGTQVPIKTLDRHVNAIGYATGQRLVYGIAPRQQLLPLLNVGHVVTIDPRGRLADLGPVRDTGPVRVPPDGLLDATAGAVAGSRLYVRDGGSMYTVDIDPHGASFLGLLRAVELSPGYVARSVEDFAVNPANGLLYGVSTADTGSARVVSIDPNSGRVSTVSTPAGLPGRGNYGAAVIGPDNALYATNNLVNLHSRLYRVPLNNAGVATELATRAAVSSSDAAGCITTTNAAPPPRPAPAPPPRAAPAPTATRGVPGATVPAATATASSTAAATVPVPGGTATLRPEPGMPSPPNGRFITGSSPRASGEDERVATERRWMLILLIILIAAGSASRLAAARNR